METVQITIPQRLPGVELARVGNSPRVWGHLNSAYAFGTMTDWQGELTYRRRVQPLGRGECFLFDPGELFRGAPERGQAGSFDVLEIRPELFEELSRNEGIRGSLHFASVVLRAPRPLARALDALTRALVDDEDLLTQQSRLVELVHAATGTVMEQLPRSARAAAPLGPCERLREILHSTEAPRLSLSEFARAADVSQFQLLRTFKRRYGSPPHAYGVHVRIDRARELLRRGHSVAEAAAATDFTDQSHFTRHFRRIWGVTPGTYAAARS